MLNLDTKKIECKVDGSVYEVRVPSVDEIDVYSKKLKEQGEEDSFLFLKDFLAELGMPKEVSGKLSAESFNSLVEALMPAKKK